MKEHINDNKNESFLSKLHRNFNHEFDCNYNIIVVDSESDYRKRLISEMIWVIPRQIYNQIFECAENFFLVL